MKTLPYFLLQQLISSEYKSAVLLTGSKLVWIFFMWSCLNVKQGTSEKRLPNQIFLGECSVKNIYFQATQHPSALTLWVMDVCIKASMRGIALCIRRAICSLYLCEAACNPVLMNEDQLPREVSFPLNLCHVVSVRDQPLLATLLSLTLSEFSACLSMMNALAQ